MCTGGLVHMKTIKEFRGSKCMTALVVYDTIDSSGMVRFLSWIDDSFNNLST